MFSLLLMADGEPDAEDKAFNEKLSKYACGELEALPDGFKDHALWLQWRDRNKGKDIDQKGIRPLVLPALKYIAWCRAGLIPDKHHNATVRDAFKLTDTGLVNDWLRRYPMPAIPENPTGADGIDAQVNMRFAGATYKDLKR